MIKEKSINIYAITYGLVIALLSISLIIGFNNSKHLWNLNIYQTTPNDISTMWSYIAIILPSIIMLFVSIIISLNRKKYIKLLTIISIVLYTGVLIISSNLEQVPISSIINFSVMLRFIIITILSISYLKNIDNYEKLNPIIFENTITGEIKSSPIGFSWTTLFFQFFPALFRMDWKWAIIQFLLIWPTMSISIFVFPFIYNKLYIKDLINQTFLPINDNDINILISKGIITKNQIDFIQSKSKKENIINKEILKKHIPDHVPQTIAQQLKDFKELLDNGTITQEEFEKKKSELLK